VKDRELDALVAEKVMGWKWRTHVGINVLHHPTIAEWMEKEDPNGVLSEAGRKGKQTLGIDGIFFYDSSRRPPERYPEFPCYSTQLIAAFQVVEKLRSWRRGVRMEQWDHLNAGLWCVEIGMDEGEDVFAGDVTLPGAICAAALKVVGLTPPPSGKENL
jgi:hypothetical protein